MGVFDSVGVEDHARLVFATDPISDLRCSIAHRFIPSGDRSAVTRFPGREPVDRALGGPYVLSVVTTGSGATPRHGSGKGMALCRSGLRPHRRAGEPID